jgi:sodium transport system permease protein
MTAMLLNIYWKEMKDSFRDRRTLLLTVFLPIIMMTGLTLFYENMVSEEEGEEEYTLAVETSISEEVVHLLAPFDNINLMKSANPEGALEEGEAQGALVVSSDFSRLISSGEKAQVTLIGNSFSQKSTTLMSMVSNAFSIYEKEIIENRLEAQGVDNELVQPLTIEKRELSEDDPNINLLAMLIPMILSIAIGVGSAPAAADLFAGEKEKKTMEALLMTPVNRATLLMAKWLTVSSIGAIIGFVTLIVVSLEIFFLTEHLKKAVSFGENTAVIISVCVLVTIVYAMFSASLLMLTSIIGKTVKEAQSYSSPIMMLAVIPVMITTGIGVNEFEFFHFAIPVLNLFSVLKELLFGIVDYGHVLVSIGSNLLVLLIVFIICRILFLKDKWVMN